jgi:hypothetical protein
VNHSLNEKRESKSLGGGLEEAKGKEDSLKVMCQEINWQFMMRSRHQYHL